MTPTPEVPPPQRSNPLHILENLLSVAALSLMAFLPVSEMAARALKSAALRALPSSCSNSPSGSDFWGRRWLPAAGICCRFRRVPSFPPDCALPPGSWRSEYLRQWRSVSPGPASSLCRWKSQSGSWLLQDLLPKWVALAVMPIGFGVIALRAVWLSSPKWTGRALSAIGLLLPIALYYAGTPAPTSLFTLGVLVLVLATLLGLPIFAVFGGFALLLFWRAGTPIASVPVEMYRLVASPLLPSIPLFTFAGYLMVEGGATRRFLRVFTALFSWAPGGMAIVTVLICAIFTWGGSGLTILSLGGLLVPVLIRSRYPERFSIGLLTASGSLGLLFPPSLPVILYGVYAATAIDRLFIGGLLPGLLMVTLAASMGIRQGLKSETVRDPFSAKEAFSAIWEAKWELLIPAIMLTGLFGGFGTLTEAAALTAVVALFIEVVIYRGISIRHDYMRVCVECATVVGGILLILGVALGFTNYLVDAEIPTRIVDWVLGHIHSKYLFLLLLNMCLLVVGSLMDIFAAILVIVPLLKPLTVAYGIDPVQMGIIFLSNLELGYLMPPVGINLCLAAYRFEKPMFVVYRALLPFLLVLLCGVLLITYVPWMTSAPLRWLGK